MKNYSECKELKHEAVSTKRYKLACAPMEDSDQTAHLCSLIRVFDGPLSVANGSTFLHLEILDSIRTADTDFEIDLMVFCMHMVTCRDFLAFLWSQGPVESGKIPFEPSKLVKLYSV